MVQPSANSDLPVTYDFTQVIKENGHGEYTFTVKAVVDTEKGGNKYKESAVSEKSSAARAIRITLSAQLGITAVTPEEAFLLIVANSENNYKEVSATAKELFNFQTWTCEQPGISFEKATEATTNVKVASTYAGPLEVVVKALSTTDTAPVIHTYAPVSTQKGKLEATVSDEATGIIAYAFSTATSSDAVSAAEWTDVTKEDQAPGTNVTASITLTLSGKAGNYYFYAKNGVNKITRSTAFVKATEVGYNGYYSDSGEQTKLCEYMLGNVALTLKTPKRPGYSFNGWYLNSSFTGNFVTTLSNTESGAAIINVYGKWTRNEVDFSQQPQSVTSAYTGKAHLLTAQVSEKAGSNPEYQWYKKSGDLSEGTPIEGATSNTYEVKDVADSATYYVIACVTLDNVKKEKRSDDAVVSITQATLKVKAKDMQISLREAAPTYTIDEPIGFVNGETAQTAKLKDGTFTCDYKQGDATKGKAGTYDIMPVGFTAPNYKIEHTKGTLTVRQK